MEEGSNENITNAGAVYEGQTDWRSALPPDLQTTVSNYNNLENFVKAFRDTKSFVSKKVEDFSKSDWDAYRAMTEQTNGAPVSPDGYEIDMIPPDGGESSLTEEDTQYIRELAFQTGLSNGQAQAIHDVADNFVKAVTEARQHEINCRYEDCLKDLSGAWGNAWESKVAAIGNTLNNILPQLSGTDAESIIEELAENGILNSPVMLKTLAALGEMMSDMSSKGYGNIAPSDARSRFENMRNDPEFMRARRDPHHPLHLRAKEEFAAMCEYANG
jgi:hypothetical protein